MIIEEGDSVRFKKDLPLGVGLKRTGQIGVVTRIRTDSGLARADIEFPDGTVEPGINVHQIEKA